MNDIIIEPVSREQAEGLDEQATGTPGENPYLRDHKINRGDIRVFTADPGPNGEFKRANFVNRGGLKMLPFPGDVVDKANPRADYTYHWHDTSAEDSDDRLEELLTEEGWRIVNKREFFVRKWGQDAEGNVRKGRFLMLCLPEHKWAEKQNEVLDWVDRRLNITRMRENFAEDVRREGLVPTEGTRDQGMRDINERRSYGE